MMSTSARTTSSRPDPASALGRADGNPCREDIEEAVRRIGRDTYLVNVVEAGATIVGAVAGDVVYAHREAVRLARPWCEVELRRRTWWWSPAPLPGVRLALPGVEAHPARRDPAARGRGG